MPRWIIAAGLAGAILEGIVWMGVFMAMAGVSPDEFVVGAVAGVLIAAGIFGLAFAIALSRTLRR